MSLFWLLVELVACAGCLILGAEALKRSPFVMAGWLWVGAAVVCFAGALHEAGVF